MDFSCLDVTHHPLVLRTIRVFPRPAFLTVPICDLPPDIVFLLVFQFDTLLHQLELRVESTLLNNGLAVCGDTAIQCALEFFHVWIL